MKDCKVLEFNREHDFYLSNVDDMIDNGDFLNALVYLRYSLKAKNIRKDDLENTYLKMAEVYSLTENYEESNDIYFKLLNDGVKNLRIYAGLTENFIDMEDLLSYFYYSTMGIEIKIYEDMDFQEGKTVEEIIIEDLKENKELEVIIPRKGYKVVYPPSDVDYDEELDYATLCIKQGNFLKAFELLSKIPSENKDYDKAQNLLSVAYMSRGQYLKARECAERSVAANEKNIFSLCTLVSCYHLLEDEVQLEKTLDKIYKINEYTIQDSIKIATILCETDRKESIKYLERLLVEFPYNKELLYLTGIAYFNAQNYSKAVHIFNKLLILFPENPIIKYYMRQFVKVRDEVAENNKSKLLETEDVVGNILYGFDNGIAVDKSEKARLGYQFNVPYYELIRRQSQIREFIKNGEFKKFRLDGGYLNELMDWIVEIDDLTNWREIAEQLIDNNSYLVPFVKEKLIKTNVSFGMKSTFVSIMLRTKQRGKLRVLFNNRYKETQLIYPDGFDGFDDTAKEVFYAAYFHCAYFLEKFENKLKGIIEKLNEKIVKDKKRFSSYNSLVFAVCVLTDKYFNDKMVMEDFKISNVAVKRYLKELSDD